MKIFSNFFGRSEENSNSHFLTEARRARRKDNNPGIGLGCSSVSACLGEIFGSWLFLWIFFVIVFSLCACTSKTPPAKEKSTLVMTTTYPVEVLTRSVVQGTNLQVERLLSSQGACAHDVMLGTQERLRLSKAGVLVVNGGGMEPFVKDLQKSDPQVTILSCVPVQESQCTHGCAHEHDAEETHAFAALLPAAACLERIALGLANEYPELKRPLHAQGRLMREQCVVSALRLQSQTQSWTKRNVIIDHSILEPLAKEWNLKVLANIDPTGTHGPQTAARMAELQRLGAQADAILSSGSKVAAVVAKESRKPLVMMEVLNQGPSGATVAHLISSMERNADRLEQILGKP